MLGEKLSNVPEKKRKEKRKKEKETLAAEARIVEWEGRANARETGLPCMCKFGARSHVFSLDCTEPNY